MIKLLKKINLSTLFKLFMYWGTHKSFSTNAKKVNGRHSVKLHANMNLNIYIFLKNEMFFKNNYSLFCI